MSDEKKILTLAAAALLALTGYYLGMWHYTDAPYGVQDPDVWMRLARVWQWHDGGGWYDRMLPRLNAPYGLENHWTRPLDMLLLALAWPASFFVTYKQALLFASVIYNPVIWWLSILGILGICRTLNIGKAGKWMSVFVLITDSLIRSPFMIGRADHHSLLLFVFVWMLYLLVRFDRERKAPHIVAAGLLAGLGLWISPEFLVAIGVAVGVPGAFWIAGGDAARLNAAAKFIASALLMAIAAVMLEWPPGAWLTVSHIRISIVHLQALGVALATLAVLAALSPRLRNGWLRGVASVFFGLAAVAWLQSLYPRFIEGPMAETPRALVAAFELRLTELKPIYKLYGIAGSIGILFSAALGMAGYLFFIRKKRGDMAVWLLFAMTLAYTILMTAMIRWSGYAMVAGVVAWALMADSLERWAVQRKAAFKMEQKQSPLLAAIAILIIARDVFFLPASHADSVQQTNTASDCRAQLVKMIERNELPGAAQTVLTHLDQAGQVVFWTPHAAIASNYNYNEEGIRDLDRFLFAQDAAEARAVVKKRGIGTILLCPDGIHEPFFPDAGNLKPRFIEALSAGKLPSWLEPAGKNNADGLVFLRVKPAHE